MGAKVVEHIFRVLDHGRTHNVVFIVVVLGVILLSSWTVRYGAHLREQLPFQIHMAFVNP